ncbi:bifunctional 4-hydroxy-2-oxoglutarate aldolase/2-dehydro-3-deoxy-phosphogluconate aldolase [Candidatus Omnitrophota bacterium]
MGIERFDELPLMGIVRGVGTAETGPLIETVIKAGLKTIEITMNTPGAADIISIAGDLSKGRIDIGAGTVLSTKDLDAAIEAGASFVVMPSFIKDVVSSCIDKKIPVFPGAFTPKEVFEAWEAGAYMVKIFPSGMLGPQYIKQLKGPFDKVKLMAVGGVRPDNIADYFSCGVDAVAFGGRVFRKEWIAKGDFGSIGDLVAQYVKEVKKAKDLTL